MISWPYNGPRLHGDRRTRRYTRAGGNVGLEVNIKRARRVIVVGSAMRNTVRRLRSKILLFFAAFVFQLQCTAPVFAQSLRELATQRGIDIGANFPSLVDGNSPNNWRDSPTIKTEMKIAAAHFTIMSAGWQMFPGHSWKGPHEYDFEGADTFVKWCQENNIRVHGHGLGYACRVNWLKKHPVKSQDETLELRRIYESYVQETARHFNGKVHMWDVCNEQLLPAYVFRGFQTNHNYWRAYADGKNSPASGIEWYRRTFRIARENDPHAKLILLDFNNEVVCPKSDGMLELVKHLKAESVPIDGVGFQMHLRTDVNRSKAHGLKTDEAYYESLFANMERFAELGLELWFTEMDVSIDPMKDLNDELNRQAEIYEKVLDVALKFPQFKGVKFWGVMDRNTWGEIIPERPNLFDENGTPKQAFYRVQSALKRHEGRTKP